jgi:hypothetical protein
MRKARLPGIGIRVWRWSQITLVEKVSGGLAFEANWGNSAMAPTHGRHQFINLASIEHFTDGHKIHYTDCMLTVHKYGWLTGHNHHRNRNDALGSSCGYGTGMDTRTQTTYMQVRFHKRYCADLYGSNHNA